MTMATHECSALMNSVRDAVRPHLQPGERIIYRSAFRWLGDDGHVLPNHYEMFDIESLAEEFGYVIVHHFHHVAVISDREAPR